MKRIFLIIVFLTSLVVLSACLRRGASSEEASGETPGPATLIPTLLATKEEDIQPEDMDAVETEEPPRLVALLPNKDCDPSGTSPPP